jgi:glycosyltransferase involved in cell wall biosynthesis
MKIAQIAPTWFSIPPQGYGGVEVVISELTEELVNRGHDVTLFASADSKTKAKLFSVIEKAPSNNPLRVDYMSLEMKYLYNMFMALEKQEEFDLIHWHFGKDIAPIMFASLAKTPSVITIHNHFNKFDTLDLSQLIKHYQKTKYFISISNSHRKEFPFEYIETVYNGIDINQYDYNDKPEDYLVWLGRFEKIKGPEIAIQIALKLNKPLKLAGPKDDSDFFKKEVEPYLGKNNIEYVGEVDLIKKNKLLGNAIALISPINWEEPFGLVVPEANACGTPVVAYKRGAMPEIIKDGVNGYSVVADDINAIIEVLVKIDNLPSEKKVLFRKSCRQYAENNFTISKMVDGYEKVYQKILNQ